MVINETTSPLTFFVWYSVRHWAAPFGWYLDLLGFSAVSLFGSLVHLGLPVSPLVLLLSPLTLLLFVLLGLLFGLFATAGRRGHGRGRQEGGAGGEDAGGVAFRLLATRGALVEGKVLGPAALRRAGGVGVGS